MDVPITKPSMVSYADEIDFAQLLEKLLKQRHNGFMRITSGPDEGYILFKDGKQVAAEFGRFSKSEAVENIMSATQSSDTVIEVFDLRPTNLDYLQDVNKPFLMEPDFDVYQIINELKGTETEATEKEPESVSEPDPDQAESIKTKKEIEKPESEPAISELSKSEKKHPDSKLEDQDEKTDPVSPETDLKSSDIESSTEADVKETVQIESESDGTVEEVQTSADTIDTSGPETAPETVSEMASETVSESEDKSSQTAESVPADVNPMDEASSTEIPKNDEPEKSGLVTDETKSSEPSESNKKIDEIETPETPIKSDTESSVESPVSIETAINKESESVLETKTDQSIDASKSENDTPAPSKDSLKEELKSMEAKPESEVEPETDVKGEPMDRSKLMEKYGIKEMNDDDVDGILDDYKGGSLNDDDVEKIEFSLMNKIKKSIFGIPKIKGAEVMVFLENSLELTGDINIIIEYEAKGFFSRLMGESKDIENLRRQVINIVQIEIKKSFRKYPEIVSNFNINVEIS